LEGNNFFQYFKKLLLIARPVHGKVCSPKTAQERLACSSYTTCSQNSNEFEISRKTGDRGIWFVYVLLGVIISFTSSSTSNLHRCLKTLFGFSSLPKNNFTGSWPRPKSQGRGRLVIRVPHQKIKYSRNFNSEYRLFLTFRSTETPDFAKSGRLLIK